MKFPEYTDDAYWTDVIEQYIHNNNKHPGWYNIEHYMWEYFKDCLKRNNRFFFKHPLSKAGAGLRRGFAAIFIPGRQVVPYLDCFAAGMRENNTSSGFDTQSF